MISYAVQSEIKSKYSVYTHSAHTTVTELLLFYWLRNKHLSRQSFCWSVHCNLSAVSFRLAKFNLPTYILQNTIEKQAASLET